MTNSPQIAVYDAIPFQEFAQNPYTVLVTTSLGGHLSWFEIGGGRWHARPVGISLAVDFHAQANSRQICNFLGHMATEIDLDSITPNANGEALKTQFVTEFDPVRRKLQVISN